jgi:hypothetical protein
MLEDACDAPVRLPYPKASERGTYLARLRRCDLIAAGITAAITIVATVTSDGGSSIGTRDTSAMPTTTPTLVLKMLGNRNDLNGAEYLWDPL